MFATLATVPAMGMQEVSLPKVVEKFVLERRLAIQTQGRFSRKVAQTLVAHQLRVLKIRVQFRSLVVEKLVARPIRVLKTKGQYRLSVEVKHVMEKVHAMLMIVEQLFLLETVDRFVVH